MWKRMEEPNASSYSKQSYGQKFSKKVRCIRSSVDCIIYGKRTESSRFVAAAMAGYTGVYAGSLNNFGVRRKAGPVSMGKKRGGANMD